MQNVFRPKQFLWLPLTLWALLCATSYADVTEVTASVDKNPAMVDEAIILEVTANDVVDNNLFDASPLLKDFVVGRTSVSTQTQIINFDMTRTTRWTTRLIPRKPGRYTIPAFDIAGQRSAPIELMVLPASQATADQARDIYIEAEVDLTKVYLQQQIHYVAKLYLSRDLQRGSLTAPQLENADIRQIGKDKEYSEIAKGQRYRVIERRFAIIPQSSGNFTIEGPIFDGEVSQPSNRSYGFFNQSKAVSRVGNAIDIEVLPMPDNYQQHWLPSEYVELHQEWQNGGDEYRVGEPITRILTLTALGVVEEQLPEINSQYPATVKSYPDQASTSTVEKDDTLVAQRRETIAIIPTQPGELTLPEIRVPWFNTLTGQTEYARLPAQTLSVAPAQMPQGGPVQGSSAQTPAAAPKDAATDAQEPPATDRSHNTELETTTGINWWALTSGILLVLWVLTLGLWWRYKRTSPVTTQRSEAGATKQDEAKLWQSLQQAVKQQDSKAVIDALTPWLCHHLNMQGTLAECQQHLNDPELNEQINHLLASRYGKQTGHWQGNKLIALLQQHRKTSRQSTHRPGHKLVSLKIE
ncbi:BatD family protein [Lacimicrobium sp. SS2-24]|uniref:BatD family protein n=1 Tax=Lacimicrobium sp. SS2-24 TaxID=2005569 RepID=UPI000B4ABA01|nr:BatD family protein [Lacimicrobium sp. SS2-24]